VIFFQFSFVNFEAHSLDSSKTTGDFPEISKFNQFISQTSKSNQLHVVIFFLFSFINFKAHSLDSSETISDFPEISNFNHLIS
jgi:hypothetical protein